MMMNGESVGGRIFLVVKGPARAYWLRLIRKEGDFTRSVHRFFCRMRLLCEVLHARAHIYKPLGFK